MLHMSPERGSSAKLLMPTVTTARFPGRAAHAAKVVTARHLGRTARAADVAPMRSRTVLLVLPMCAAPDEAERQPVMRSSA